MEDSRIIDLYWNRDESAIPATSEKYGAYCTSIARNILKGRKENEEKTFHQGSCCCDRYDHDAQRLRSYHKRRSNRQQQ